ncbi:hypothetical protein OK016_02525 [Vibrio chagasii]|nr:hypothetical protein [Vibrio chagasii]
MLTSQMFEEVGEGNLHAMHHPFTSPLGVTAEELKANPAAATLMHTTW